MSSAVSKLAALNAGLLRFCIQHSDFNAVENPDNLPQRPQADYDWLQNALQNFETDVEKMKKINELLKDSESTEGQLVGALEELEYLIEDLDNANMLPKIDAVKSIVTLLNNKSNKVRAWAAQVVAVATHNLVGNQLIFMQHGALANLILCIKTETSETVRHKLIGALSSITSANPTAEAFFVQMNGLALLATFLQASSAASTRSRIIFFLTRLALTNPEIIGKVKELHYLEPILSGLVDDSAQLRETSARALLWIINHQDNRQYLVSLKVKELTAKVEELKQRPSDDEEAALDLQRSLDELALLAQLLERVQAN